MTDHKDRMQSGELYQDNPELAVDRERAERLYREFGTVPKTDLARRNGILSELFGSLGEDTDIVAPIYCDYGYNIHIGDRSFLNFGAVLLDVADIRIGADVMVGPNTQFLTPFHPIEPELRREHWEGAKPITIGDNVWIGAGVLICPGVTIGDNSVIGTGAVVTKDVPANVVAVGNPAKVVREI